jgi:nucleoside-diphosphate-sugar epimerase
MFRLESDLGWAQDFYPFGIWQSAFGIVTLLGWMPEKLRIAVTGGSGGVGRWVVRCLIERGYSVVNLDRVIGDDDRAEFVDCDIRERSAIEPVLRGCDSVVHLAEIPSAGCPFPKDEIYWNNTRAASVVLQAAADLQLRHAVYASTAQVYGSWGDEHVTPVRLPIDEEYPVNPRNVYSVSKVANEGFCKYLSGIQNLGISIVRFPGVVATMEREEGLWKYREYDGRLSDGMCTFIHGSDLARGIAAAIEKGREGCEVYNLSAADILSTIPLRERLHTHHPDFPELPVGWPDLKSPLVIEKARKLLGWEPEWSFGKYLRERDGGGGRQI